MKEIYNEDTNGIEDIGQLNTLEEMGIGLNSTFRTDDTVELQAEIEDKLKVQYKNIPNIDENKDKIEEVVEDSNEVKKDIIQTDNETSIQEQILSEETVGHDESVHSHLKADEIRQEILLVDVEESTIAEDMEQDAEDKYILDGEVEEGSVPVKHDFKDVMDEERDLVQDENIELKDNYDDLSIGEIEPYISKSHVKNYRNKSYDKKRTFIKIDKKRLIKMGIIAAVFAVICTSIIFVAQSVVAGKINFTDFSDTKVQEEQFDTESILTKNTAVVQTDEFNWDMIKGNPTYDENIYNILIVGGDIVGKKDLRGNSDTLIIVSIDKNTKKIKLSSIMRDTYVPIPGYSDNKINSAYATGGVPLIRQVIEENFKVTIDSTVVINYSTFVKAIEILGGVDGVVLNEREANFINKECRKKNHESNLTEGTHNLDAVQSLHFARIRKIKSDIYGSDDFGRTARQRYVIKQLFKKYKDLSYAQIASLITGVMGELEVDEALKNDLFLLVQVALEFDAETLDEFRLPMDGAYSFASVPIPGSYQNMSVVKIDDYWQRNVDALHMFIYGETIYGTVFEDEEDESTEDDTTGSNGTGMSNDNQTLNGTNSNSTGY